MQYIIVMNDKKYAPLLPFDDTKNDSFKIYNEIHYVRDASIMEDDPIMMTHPTMIKYFRCEDTEPVKLGGD